MQDYYAARANEYDQIYLKPERQADLRKIEQWLPEVLSGRTVLEVACGTGYWTQFIAPSSASIVAVDSSLETLRVAHTRVPQNKVHLLASDAYSLPVPPATFDAGFAGFWWSHIPRSRISEFLRGFHAALVPGSMVVLLDNRFVPGSSTAISETDAEGNTYQSRPLSNGSVHSVLKNFPSHEELLRSVAGLAQEVRYHEWRYYWALEYATSAP
jgi:demethylmenaquinone methyltransferase/2-methoxy-6-polyprenyl-1,4-benzoquinol methylase